MGEVRTEPALWCDERLLLLLLPYCSDASIDPARAFDAGLLTHVNEAERIIGRGGGLLFKIENSMTI